MKQFGGDGDISITLLQGMQGLESLQDAWNEIVSGMPRRHFFQLWEWYYSYVKCLEPNPDSFRVFLFSKADIPVAIFPLQGKNISLVGLKHKTLAFPAHDHMQLCDLIGSEDALRLPLFKLLTGYLKELHESWDLIQLPFLLEDAWAIRATHDHPPSRSLLRREGRCYFLDTTGTYESFQSALPKKFGGSLRRAKQCLAELSGVQFAFTQGGPELEDKFEAFVDVEASGWKGALGSGTAIKLDPRLTDFYRTLARALSGSGRLTINTLTADGKCIAAQFCIVLDDTVYLLKLGYDEEYKRYAPGNLLMDRVMKWCIEDDRITNINLISDASWLTLWRARAYETYNLYLFNTTPVGLVGFANLKSIQVLNEQYRAYVKPHLPRRIQEWIVSLSHET